MEHTPYDVLGIPAFSDSDTIKSAFRNLAKKHHPDMAEGDRAQFERTREAYEFLSNKAEREHYDVLLRDRIFEEEKKRQENEAKNAIREYDTADKLQIIIAWSKTKKTFNPSFANSCVNKLAAGIELTEKQINGIDNIIVRFAIDCEEWLAKEIQCDPSY